MFANRIYYGVKPFLPWPVRMGLRRRFAANARCKYDTIWPIYPGSERPPGDWTGWPNGKRFAVVLTHDVESHSGLQKCRELMRIEAELGFRSCFNFIPEGSYSVDRGLRDELVSGGFEVGVHDLNHDGRLFRSRQGFSRRAARINDHLRSWNALGFRSAFMHHRLDWLHDLEIEYDTSTFDTDPFEPQPHGMHTIFPFWVSNPSAGNHALAPAHHHAPPSNGTHCLSGEHCEHSVNESTNQRFNGGRSGYLELPYTLPQDSTLFLLLRERTIDIWRAKLDWIAAHGGMALLNVHPDYLCFNGHRPGAREFPAKLYREFLEYVRAKYDGAAWHARPRDVAAHCQPASKSDSITQTRDNSVAIRTRGAKRTIWVDLDNTPHVPFFRPIIRELERRGYRVVCTARNAFQVCDLARKKRVSFVQVGHHYGKNRIAKVYGLFYRAAQLLPWALAQKPMLAVSHGSRSQVIASNLLRIPTVLLADYEYAKYPPMMRPKWEMVPDAIPNEVLYCPPGRVRNYPGIKEDVYVPEFHPDGTIMADLGVSPRDIIVTVRPPATEAHYHNPESEILFERLMDFLLADSRVRVVLLPRNCKQGAEIRTAYPGWFSHQRVIIPGAAVDGLNLLYHSDLVVSGGGTMNREAAALGVPVYSIFRGQIGAVDRQLERNGQLILIKSADEIAAKIEIEPRAKGANGFNHKPPALEAIVAHIEDILAIETT